MPKIFAFLFILSVFQVTKSFSQSDSIAKPAKTPKLCGITMRDGSLYKGHIEKQTDSLIYLKSSVGVLVLIPKHYVSNIDFITGHTSHDTIGGMHIHTPGIAQNYYVTSSNAFLLEKGRIFGSSNYLAFYNINYALSRNFSMGVSSLAIGAPSGFHVKGNFEVAHKVYFGLEGIVGSLFYLSTRPSYGVGGTAKLTYGDEKRNYTFFGGYAQTEYYTSQGGGGRRRGRPVTYNYHDITSLFAGAAISLQMTDRTCFVSEIFTFPAVSVCTLSAAIRTTSKQKISWVWGLQSEGNFSLNSTRAFIILPYFGFSFRI